MRVEAGMRVEGLGLRNATVKKGRSKITSDNYRTIVISFLVEMSLLLHRAKSHHTWTL